MAEKTTLLVMAAGMGSRFGGPKQITPVGANGEVILDYSIYDAKKAGFNKVVFVIKKEMEADFREAVGKRIEKKIEVEYAFQSLSDLPSGFSVPEGRVKPFGTGQAVLSAKNVIDEPFGVINADDFYGSDTFKKLAAHLKNEDTFCMVGFALANTLTEYGTVARGICELENGFLKKVTEHTALDKNSGFAPETIVSMNTWGFQPRFFEALEEGFVKFLSNMTDPIKNEYFLPSVVDGLIQSGKEQVRVLSTDSKWYGVTYKDDLPFVQQAIAKLTAEGNYDGI